jgi:hypothetical protein
MIYRRVNPLAWDDDVLIEADDFETRVWFGLLTGPQVTNLPGLMLCSSLSLAEAVRRPPDRVLTTLRAFVDRGRLELDEKFRVIRLPNAPKHNLPENPKVVLGWWKRWCELPESQLKYRHIQSLREAIDIAMKIGHGGDFSDVWARTFGTVDVDCSETVSRPSGIPIQYPMGYPSDTLSHTLSIQKQDQDQDQKQDQEQEQEGGTGGGLMLYPTGNDFDAFWKVYPRKLAKGDALKAWKQMARERPPIRVIIAAIEAQKGSDGWTKDGGGFIPYPATWLRASRWDDEVEKPRKPETDADRRRRLEDEDFKRGLAAADEARQVEEEDDCGD